MTVRPIRLLGDPVLRTPCEEVTRFDAAIERLVADLIDTVVAEPGRAGLAANQVGVSLAAFSYRVDGQVGYVINPRLEGLEGQLGGEEGCLSIPGVCGRPARYVRAIVQGADVTGGPVTLAGTGEMARCFQHEVDHLRGTLYIDRLEGDERRRVMRQLAVRDLARQPQSPR